MSKKLRKPLSWLLALCMILSLLPMSVFAAGNTQGSLIAFEYDNGGTDLLQGSLTIIVQNESGQKLDEITVEDYYKTWADQDKIQLISDKYTIISLSLKDSDWGTVLSVNNIDGRSCTFSLTYTVDHETLVLTVREFDGPEVDEEINHGGLIEYRIYDAQLLKMLYAAGNHDVSIDTKIDRVEMEFVRDYASSSDIELEHISPVANQLGYYFTSLSNASGNGNPYNIKELTVTFDNGRKATIPAKNLFYHKAGSSLYEIKDNAMADLCVVTFYTQPGVLVEYRPYAIRFVEAGKSIQSAGVSMPETPEYGGTYIFVNWSYDQNGERPFLKSDVIEQDTDIFARRTSSTAGGTEIHVMNQNDSLINRFLELYNAQNNTQATKSDIALDSVQITVYGQNGEHTNPNYDNGATECGWRDDNGYFFVVNYDAEQGLPNFTNTHIPHNEMTKIVMTANVNGQNAQVEIPVGDGAGELSVNLNSDELEYIVQLIVNEAPDAPNDNNLIGNPETPDDGILGSVKVECTTEEPTHANKSKEYGALADSYVVGEVTALADGGYTCDVTVYSEKYVALYDGETDVEHTTTQVSKTITLTWDNATGKWVDLEGKLPVTFEVECDSTTPPDPENPDVPEYPDLVGLGNVVTLDCTANNDHSDASYSIAANTESQTDSYEIGNKTQINGVWTCTVTVKPVKSYLDKYKETNGDHEYVSPQASKSLTLTWDNTNMKWTAQGNVTFNVKCKTTPGPNNPVAPSAPSEDNLKGLLQEKIKVYCVTTDETVHPSDNYGLISGGYTVYTDVTYNVTTSRWEYVIAINGGTYAQYYDNQKGYPSGTHHTTETKLVTFVWNAASSAWETADANLSVEFPVYCKPHAPSKELLDDIQVEVTCTNGDATHAPKTKPYTLADGVYESGEVMWDSSKNQYACEITVYSSAYVAKYNTETDSKHELDVANQEPATFKVYYQGGQWVVSGIEVKFTVKCQQTEPQWVTVTFDSGDHGDFGWYHVTSKDVELTKDDKLAAYQIPDVYPDNGYKFIGWYKDGSASWKLYSDEALLKMEFNSDATFIAQYKYVGGPSVDVDDDYDVIYNANFTDGGYPRRVGYDEDDKVTVSDNKWFEREGYTFIGWNTKANGNGDSYLPGDTFRMPDSDVYLYAQWQKEKPGPDETGVSRWLETEDHNAYLTGYPDSTFGADRNMTRAEVAQMFYALLKNKNVMITTSFSDVSNDAWYATAVKTMASLGMMSGYPDGTFRPDEPITRAEFATVALAFAYEPDNARCSYLDVSTSAWYYTYVAQATTYGWIGGYPDGTFRPNNSITRVEVCVIVNNMLGRTPDEDYIDRNEDELVNFVDLSDRYWGYYTIMEATNGHEYTGNYSNETWESVK